MVTLVISVDDASIDRDHDTRDVLNAIHNPTVSISTFNINYAYKTLEYANSV